MAKTAPHLKWLLNELPQLHEQKVIDEKAQANLTQYCKKQLHSQTSPRNFFMLSLVGLGVLMIAGGIILLLAHNWDMLSKGLRVSIATIPLLLGIACGTYTIIKNKDARFKEASAVFTACGIACLISLVSQIYNLDGSLEGFLMLVLAVTLPLIYLFKSYSYCLLYCTGLIILLITSNGNHTVMYYAIAVLPWLLHKLFTKPNDSYKATFARYILLLPLICLIPFETGNDTMLMSSLSFFVMIYSIGLFYHSKNLSLIQNPFLVLGWIQFVILLLTGCFVDLLSNQDLAFEWTVLGMILVPCCFILYHFFKNKLSSFYEMITVLSGLLMLLFVGKTSKEGTLWIFTIYTIIFSITFIILGIKKKSLLNFEGGIVTISLFSLIKFFDSDMGTLPRAIFFILIGIIFIVSNVIVGKIIKKETGDTNETY